MRVLPYTVWSMIVVVPPASALALHGVTVLLTWAPFCSTQLLSSALSTQRQAAAAAALELALLPLAAAQPITAQMSAARGLDAGAGQAAGAACAPVLCLLGCATSASYSVLSALFKLQLLACPSPLQWCPRSPARRRTVPGHHRLAAPGQRAHHSDLLCGLGLAAAT